MAGVTASAWAGGASTPVSRIATAARAVTWPALQRLPRGGLELASAYSNAAAIRPSVNFDLRMESSVAESLYLSLDLLQGVRTGCGHGCSVAWQDATWCTKVARQLVGGLRIVGVPVFRCPSVPCR